MENRSHVLTWTTDVVPRPARAHLPHCASETNSSAPPDCASSSDLTATAPDVRPPVAQASAMAQPIAAWRTPPWPASGWGCRGRRLSRAPGNLDMQCVPSYYPLVARMHVQVARVPRHAREQTGQGCDD